MQSQSQSGRILITSGQLVVLTVTQGTERDEANDEASELETVGCSCGLVVSVLHYKTYLLLGRKGYKQSLACAACKLEPLSLSLFVACATLLLFQRESVRPFYCRAVWLLSLNTSQLSPSRPCNGAPSSVLASSSWQPTST